MELKGLQMSDVLLSGKRCIAPHSGNNVNTLPESVIFLNIVS